jgi:AcrR family transcriptional regulator
MNNFPLGKQPRELNIGAKDHEALQKILTNWNQPITSKEVKDRIARAAVDSQQSDFIEKYASKSPFRKLSNPEQDMASFRPVMNGNRAVGYTFTRSVYDATGREAVKFYVVCWSVEAAARKDSTYGNPLAHNDSGIVSDYDPSVTRHRSFINKKLKESLVNWGITDAAIYLGASGKLLRLPVEDGMRRIAADLGVGTMTLYYYVRTKDELFTLVFDSLAGEIVVPADEPLPAYWKDAISVIARRSRDCILRHPWLLDIADDPPIGPNSVRHFDQSLQAVSGLAGDLPDRLDVIMSVDEFVYGHCLMQRNNFADETLQSDDRMLGYVSELVASGDYPSLARLVAERGMAESWQVVERHARDSTRFERNLRRLLDGIELDVRRQPDPA